MDGSPAKENECEYKERDRRLKKQLINKIINNDMMIEIIKELTVVKMINKLKGDQVSKLTKIEEVQRVQKYLTQ